MSDFIDVICLLVNAQNLDISCLVHFHSLSKGLKIGGVKISFHQWYYINSFMTEAVIIDLESKSVDWFLYDNGLRHERVNKRLTTNTPTLPGTRFIELLGKWKTNSTM